LERSKKKMILVKGRIDSKLIITRPVACIIKHITSVNDDSSVVNKFEASLTGEARVVIYNRHMFKVQATGLVLGLWPDFW
jgi:hypothetical protein